MKTQVLFRKDIKSNQILAYFPNETHSVHYQTQVCFTLEESHSSCDQEYIYERTIEATPEEYRNVKWYLESYPHAYELEVL